VPSLIPPIGHHQVVANPAELSSMSSTLDELTRRVSALAEEAAAADQDDLATELFGIERALTGALRRLRKLAETPRV
jgi:hypothetical protein